MKYFGLLSIILLFSQLKVHGQQFYVATDSDIVKCVTITNGKATSVQTTGGCINKTFTIAMHGKTIYFLRLVPLNTALYRADINNNVISNCTFIANLGTAINANALTIDNSGTLYYAGSNVLYTINPANPVPVKLGTMSYPSGGDLAFYKNDLYLASPNEIVKVNIANPAQSTSYIIMTGYGSLYGLTTVLINGKSVVYAFSRNGLNTDVIQLDMDNQKIVGKVCTLPYVVDDAASIVEGGTTPALLIDSIVTTQQCNLVNRSQVQVFSKPDTANAVLTYSFSGLVANHTGLFSNLAPGNYQLIVNSSSGRVKDTVIVIPDHAFDKSGISVTKVNPVCSTAGNIQFSTANSGSYNIQYGSAVFPFGYDFSGLTAGSYSFTVLNSGGCPVDTINVVLSQDICTTKTTTTAAVSVASLSFPNTFTPNNDGINDVFEPKQVSTVTTYALSIYDRWGTLIFTSADLHTGWAGLYKGKAVAEGTYYWIATYTDLSGKKDTQNGSVTLIR